MNMHLRHAADNPIDQWIGERNVHPRCDTPGPGVRLEPEGDLENICRVRALFARGKARRLRMPRYRIGVRCKHRAGQATRGAVVLCTKNR
jgi:hypothetical protein